MAVAKGCGPWAYMKFHEGKWLKGEVAKTKLSQLAFSRKTGIPRSTLMTWFLQEEVSIRDDLLEKLAESLGRKSGSELFDDSGRDNAERALVFEVVDDRTQEKRRFAVAVGPCRRQALELGAVPLENPAGRSPPAPEVDDGFLAAVEVQIVDSDSAVGAGQHPGVRVVRHDLKGATGVTAQDANGSGRAIGIARDQERRLLCLIRLDHLEACMALLGIRRVQALGIEAIDHLLQDGEHEVGLGGEVAVERGHAHPGAARDLVDADVEPEVAERVVGDVREARAVAGGVAADRTFVHRHEREDYKRSHHSVSLLS